ncbi:MAG: chromate transporter [Waterburya sp.]
MQTSESSPQKTELKELASVFLKLGTVAFGGPVAHIAMMEEEVVKRRRWLSEEKLLDLLGVTNLIPGPNSTELAIHIGYERGGWRGLLIAGSCFILPAMIIVWLLAVFYARYQTVPEIAGLLYGIKPVICVIIAQALWKLGRKAAKDIPTTIAGIAVIIAFMAGVNEILLLFLSGLGVMIIKNFSRLQGMTGISLLTVADIGTQINNAAKNQSDQNRLGIFLFFLKVGSVLYGSGYVLLAFLQRDLVERSQWLTSQQLLDAVAIGQLTPGPVFTTATFIGYLLAGNLGAIAATIGIFLPAFAFVWLVNPWVDKLRQSIWLSGFLDGVNAASLGLMATVTYTLARTAINDWLSVILTLLGAIALFRFRINSAWLIIFGGIVGLISDRLF